MFSFILLTSLLCIVSEQITVDRRCAAVICPTGMRCEVQNIVCEAPPCPAPRVQCVKRDPRNPCANHICPEGQSCENRQVQCFAPPCFPIPQCITNSVNTTCGTNEFFNSCGGCDNTCENKQAICPAICLLAGACRCKPGFYRHSNGNCVSESDC